MLLRPDRNANLRAKIKFCKYANTKNICINDVHINISHIYM